MIQTYHMILHSPLGPRDGVLTLQEHQGIIQGTLRILSRELPVQGSRKADGGLHLTHSIITAIGEYPCRSVLWDLGDRVGGELQMDPAGAWWRHGGETGETVMSWSGERLGEQEEIL